jgi:hypothetical protein
VIIWALRFLTAVYNDGTGCYSNTVDQAQLLDFRLRKLRDAVLADGNRDALLARIRERLTARQAAKPADVAGLRKRLAGLYRDVDRAADRLRTAPDDLVDVLVPKVQGKRAERARLAVEVEGAERSVQPVDVETEAQAAVERLTTLGDELRNAKPARLRELVHRIGRFGRPLVHADEHGRVYPKHARPWPNRSERECIVFQCSRVCRDDWIRTSDFRLPKPALYQAELRPVRHSLEHRSWFRDVRGVLRVRELQFGSAPATSGSHSGTCRDFDTGRGAWFASTFGFERGRSLGESKWFGAGKLETMEHRAACCRLH